MTTSRDTEETNVDALRAQLRAAEVAATEQAAQANAAIARAQDRSYWLDRWHVDLNELMRRPGASEARAALRALRVVYRYFFNLRFRLSHGAREGGQRLRSARQTIAEERASADRVAGTSPGRAPGD
jgi:hypothetical protein